MLGRKKFVLLLVGIFILTFDSINGAILEERSFVLLDNPDGCSDPRLHGVASPLDVNSPPVLLNGTAAAAPAAGATPEAALIPATATLLATPVTPTAQSQITAAPASGSAGCVPGECRLFYQYVNVYYWPEDSQNTSCLSADPQTTTSLPNFSNIQSPSVYLVFPSIRASDGCNQIGATFAGLTTSLAPSAVSSVVSGSSTYSFNFGDLPCPPANVEWDPSKGRYKPLLAPPDFLFHLDPAFATCLPGYSQGIDPYTTLTPANAPSGPGDYGCRRGQCTRAKRAFEHALPVPWAPQKTAEPTP